MEDTNIRGQGSFSRRPCRWRHQRLLPLRFVLGKRKKVTWRLRKSSENWLLTGLAQTTTYYDTTVITSRRSCWRGYVVVVHSLHMSIALPASPIFSVVTGALVQHQQKKGVVSSSIFVMAPTSVDEIVRRKRSNRCF